MRGRPGLGDYSWSDDPGGNPQLQPPAENASRPRINPVTGLTQTLVRDPDRPNQFIWVDAIWDPVWDTFLPIDRRYRNTQIPKAPFFSHFDSQGAPIFSSTLDLGVQDVSSQQGGLPPAQVAAMDYPPSASGGSGLMLVVAVLVLGYLAWRQ